MKNDALVSFVAALENLLDKDAKQSSKRASALHMQRLFFKANNGLEKAAAIMEAIVVEAESKLPDEVQRFHGIDPRDPDSQPYVIYEDGSMEKIVGSEISEEDAFYGRTTAGAIRKTLRKQMIRENRRSAKHWLDGGAN